MGTSAHAKQLDEVWCREHFDHMSHAFAQHFHETLRMMRSKCPVAHSDQHGGFWVVTKYEDVFQVAQDWESFSSAHGVSIPPGPIAVRNIPVEVDPPQQREYKRALNPLLTPVKVAAWEPTTRALVTRLIDEFVEAGECEFMHAFAHPFPALAFFDAALDAPEEEIERVAYLASKSSSPYDPEAAACWLGLSQWIRELIEQRRSERADGEPVRGDVVDGVMECEVEGRPMTDDEIIGSIQLLILGGLHTTTSALGMIMERFCRQPEIPAMLYEQERIPAAVEELLRLDPPMIAIARTATRDAEVGGQHISAGDKVLIYWGSANRDSDVFDNPDEFDLDRSSNRHLAFGVGPHRCGGSNIARLNLRVALEEIVQRLPDVRLQTDEIEYEPSMSRGPVRLPIAFTPGPRIGVAR